MTRTWNDPRLRRVFTGPDVGDRPDPSTFPPAQQRRSRFVDELPQCKVVRAYFTGVAVGANESIESGHSAWYGLRSIRARDEGQDFSLVGAAMTLLPTDSAGGALTGYTTPKAWGDTRGMAAAIVVGTGLPIKVGAWRSAPAFIPGIEFGAAAPPSHTMVNPANMAEYMIVAGFPTGTFRDTAPNKPPLRWSFAPHVMRIRQGMSLDVALVVRRDQVHNLGSAGTFAGLADIALTIGLSRSVMDFIVE